MSRRHQGRSRRHAQGPDTVGRRIAGASPDAAGSPATGRGSPPGQISRPIEAAGQPPAPARHAPEPAAGDAAGQHTGTAPHDGAAPHNGGTPTFVPHRDGNGSAPDGPQRPPQPARAPSGERSGGCTAPQLRRFIKSRPYVPLHELRRRFGIDGGDDDVTPVRLESGSIYVGLPPHEGSLLGELLRAGEIGYELSLDPRTPVVIGVYPMRPIPRG